MPWPPSPPMTFCQEKVVTSSLSHGRSCANAADVASQSVRPARSAGIADAVGHAHAGCRAVPSEADVVVVVDCRHIDDLAVVGRVHGGFDFELFDNISDPAGAKGFPCDHFGRAFAQAATTWPSRRRQCRRRARCRCGSQQARQEFRGSDRWPRPVWICQRQHGASGPRARQQDRTVSMWGVWRRGQKKNAHLSGA